MNTRYRNVPDTSHLCRAFIKKSENLPENTQENDIESETTNNTKMFSDNSDLIKDKDTNLYDFCILNECAIQEYIEQCTNEIDAMILKQLVQLGEDNNKTTL